MIYNIRISTPTCPKAKAAKDAKTVIQVALNMSVLFMRIGGGFIGIMRERVELGGNAECGSGI